MQTPFCSYWQAWSIRLAPDAGTLVMLDWLLPPGIPWLLQSATIAQTYRQVDTWLHAASSPLLIAGKRWVSLVRGVAGRAVDRRRIAGAACRGDPDFAGTAFSERLRRRRTADVAVARDLPGSRRSGARVHLWGG